MSGVYRSSSSISLSNTGVTPGNYTKANITVGSDGRITAASNGISTPIVNLTDAQTITLDASQGTIFRVTLGGNRTLDTPINPTDGEAISVEVTQDSTGSRTLTLSSAWAFSTDAPSSEFALSTTPNSTTVFVARYRATTSTWLVLSLLRGF